MIRGAVAFGLVLRIDETVVNKPVIVTTSLSLVVFTTIFLGSTVATVQRCLFGKEMKEKAEAEKLLHPHGADESEHDVFLHPNEEKEDVTPSRIDHG